VRITETRARAYKELGIEPDAVLKVQQITPNLRIHFASVSRSGPSNLPADPIYYLNASDSPFARGLLDRYYSLSKPLRRSLPLEAFCVAAHVPPVRIEEIIIQVYERLFRQQAKLKSAAHGPEIMDKTIALATGAVDESVQLAAQTVLHKINGVIPLPAAARTSIQVTQNAQTNATAQSAATVIAAPPPEQTIRRLVDRFNEARALPVAVPAALPEAQPENVIPMPSPSREDFVESEEDQ
jgi:hypothetical protein